MVAGSAADLLTRTTLRIGRDPAAQSLAQAVHALQRVPGVLTAEADAAGAHVIVAHDAAVPAAALVAAATHDGAAADVIADTRVRETAVDTAVAPALVRARRLMSIGVTAVLAIVLIDIALPNSPDKRWLLIVPAVALWLSMLLGAFVRRRS